MAWTAFTTAAAATATTTMDVDPILLWLLEGDRNVFQNVCSVYESRKNKNVCTCLMDRPVVESFIEIAI